LHSNLKEIIFIESLKAAINSILRNDPGNKKAKIGAMGCAS
jgi:hypothetical protein